MRPAVFGGAMVFLAGLSPARAEESSAVGCESGRLEETLTAHVRARHLLDAHGLAEVLLAICPSSPRRFQWRILDALVLEELDEPLRAQAALFDVMKHAPLPERETAATLLARGYALGGDVAAFNNALGRLTPESAARLRAFTLRADRPQFQRALGTLPDPNVRAHAVEYFVPFDEAVHTRRPWLAGTLSALLPGLGQVYAGSWQGAAVAFVLNAVLIGATAELAWRRLYISAGATGVAASIFYVGNVLNAADLARRRNEQAARPYEEALERILIPEAHP